jgi:hypothetical protein
MNPDCGGNRFVTVNHCDAGSAIKPAAASSNFQRGIVVKTVASFGAGQEWLLAEPMASTKHLGISMKSTYSAGKTILASSVFLGMAFGTARAEICYNLAPFIDVLRLAEMKFVDDPAVGGTHTLVVGNWIATGAFTLPFVGSIELDVGSTTVRRLGIHAINRPGGGSGFSDCTLDGVVGGAWDLACDGRMTGFFNNSGTPLARVDCSGQPPSAPVVGKSALQR